VLIEAHLPGEPFPVGPNFAAYAQEPLVLADLVVERAECDAVGVAIVAPSRPVLQVMDLEVAALRTLRSGATPTIAIENAPLGNRDRLVMVRPHLACAIKEATQREPRRDPSRRGNFGLGSHAILFAGELHQELVAGLKTEAKASGAPGGVIPGQERLVESGPLRMLRIPHEYFQRVVAGSELVLIRRSATGQRPRAIVGEELSARPGHGGAQAAHGMAKCVADPLP